MKSIFVKYFLALQSVLLLASFTPVQATLDIPALTWTPRSDWVNVKNAPYNAKGDGVTDDTASIQAALNAVGTYGSPRAVYLPAGTYIISNRLNWGAVGALFVGCGRNTIIKWNGVPGGTMFWTNGTHFTRYIGIAWDGNNSAGMAYEHHPVSTAYDTRGLHKHESFRNFIGTTINGVPNRARSSSIGQIVPAGAICAGFSDTGNAPVAEMAIQNCLFVNCTNGIIVSNQGANNFQWLIDGCEFQNCRTGIAGLYGMADIFDNHFQGSTFADIVGGAPLSVRRCTSVGSNLFFFSTPGVGACAQYIEDCWIDGWTAVTNTDPTYPSPFNNTTSKAAITIGNAGSLEVIDCVFTHPPSGCTSVICATWSHTNLTPITVSNNYCPTISPALQVTGQVAGSLFGVNLITIPPGGRPANLTVIGSPQTTFLKTTAPADSLNVLDVRKPPYNAAGNGATDDTSAIQQAINDARNANNGSVVYLPCTQGGYRISSTLNVSGSNYTIQGSGFQTQMLWYGGTSAGTKMLAISSPQKISLEQLILKPQTGNENTAGVAVTSSGPCKLSIDGLYYYQQASAGNPGATVTNPNGPGLVLSVLPTNSLILMNHYEGPLTVNDCGKAEIFGRWVGNGRLIVNGATQPKTGFLGILDWQGGQMQYEDANHWDILVDDNQDLVIGHIYQEDMFNHLKANRGSGTGNGRVTLQGVKQHVRNALNTTILVNNYQGRVMYGPTSFLSSGSAIITQTGTNPVDVIIPSSTAGIVAPTIAMGSGGRYIRVNNVINPFGIPSYLTDVVPSGGLASIAAGLDHQRQLGWEDLKLRFDIWNNVVNTSFEADPANAAPTTVGGFTPTGWTITNAITTNGGSRNCTVVSAVSPFGSGSQGILWVDTTGTSTGSGLSAGQSLSALPANQAAEWTFDFRINSTASRNDLWIWGFAGSVRAGGIHLSANGSSANMGANINNQDTLVTSLLLNTWYRARIVVSAATAGVSNGTLYLTRWTTTGPGTTVAYTIDGISGISNTGFNRISLYSGASPGSSQNINLDNITASNSSSFALP